MSDEFASRVSHELRTPLTSVLGYLEMVIEDDALPADRQREFLRRAQANAHHLVYVLNSVHELTTLDGRGSDLDLSRFGLLQLLQEVADGFRSQADERGLTMLVGPQDDGLDIVTDRGCLSRTLVHLLSNACKYTSKGGTVHLSAWPCGRGICIEIKDTGIGIPAGEYDRVFTPFYRGSNARNAGARGAGLGLAIATALVGLIGGKMSFESEPGEGTVFRVWVPAVPNEEGPAVLSADLPPCDPADSRGRRPCPAGPSGRAKEPSPRVFPTY